MKKFLGFFALLMFVMNPAIGQVPAGNGKIIFYREYNYVGSGTTMRIYLADTLLVRLRNNSYLEFDCRPGQYLFSVNRPGQAPLSLEVEPGETYFIRLGIRHGLWNAIPEMLLVDEASALPAIESGQMRQLSLDEMNKPRSANRIGIDLAAGFGFKNHPFFEIIGGGESKISLGGGVGIGLKYGREIGRHFDLSSELMYQFSTLRPPLTNADVTFSRGILSVTPAYIIPIRDGEEMRLKLGAGFDLYWGNQLKIESSSIPGGFNDNWKYQTAFGPHASAIFEMNFSEKASFIYGLKFYQVNHSFDSSERYLPEEVSFPELNETSGAGLDLLFGFYLYF